MDFREYQEQARQTAIYPKEHSVMYPCLGLSGEAGEICNKIKKIYRGDGGDIETIQTQLKSEIGDLLWYASNLASDMGLNLQEIALANLVKLEDRKQRGVLKGSGDNR